MISRWAEPLFTADWIHAAFLHFEVDAEALQRVVPFPLDLFEGKAYVSLVAFTLRQMRLARGPRFLSAVLRPIGTHPFLNVRTYVRKNGEPGIYFLAEWMTNALSVHLGRPCFGLPYRLGMIEYENRDEHAQGSVVDLASGRRFDYAMSYPAEDSPLPLQASPRGGLAEFLHERYTCFTQWRNWARYFRVWHEPWPLRPIPTQVYDSGLLASLGAWAKHAKFIGGFLSPGCSGVWMGRPHRVRNR
jgi:uncharacterized protein